MADTRPAVPWKISTWSAEEDKPRGSACLNPSSASSRQLRRQVPRRRQAERELAFKSLSKVVPGVVDRQLVTILGTSRRGCGATCRQLGAKSLRPAGLPAVRAAVQRLWLIALHPIILPGAATPTQPFAILRGADQTTGAKTYEIVLLKKRAPKDQTGQ